MDKKILNNAITSFGTESQLKKTAEECSELIKAVLKPQSVSSITEEIADVLIMIEQLKIIFGISDRTIQAYILEKLHKLEEIVNERSKKTE